MKKLLLITLTLMLLFTLSACGGTADTGETSDQATTDATSEVLIPVPLASLLTELNNMREGSWPNGPQFEEGSIDHDVYKISLYEVEDVSQGDDAAVGTVIAIDLYAQDVQQCYYYHNKDTGCERLAVSIDASLPMVIVGKVNFGGIEGFCEMLRHKTPFEMGVLAQRNVPRGEAMYLVDGKDAISMNRPEAAVDISAPTAQADAACGYPCLIENGAAKVCVSQSLGNTSEWFTYERLFARFDLEKYFE